MKPKIPVRIIILNNQIVKHAPIKIPVSIIFGQYEKVFEIDIHLINIIRLGRVAMPQNTEANINAKVVIKCFKMS